MARLSALPEGLDPHVRHLITELRAMKERAELGNVRIAARTGFSTSSWQRYLSGRTLPPAQAVEALARAAGADEARALALHRLAAAAWDQRSAEAPEDRREGHDRREGREGRDGPPGDGRRMRRGWLAAGAAALVAVLGALALVLHPWQHDSDAAVSYACRISQSGAQWHAGLSDTRTAVLGQGNAGPDVAEAQCLLTRAGFPVGEVDGLYGPMTERAVKRFQSGHHLVPDGTMGPHTWNALRA
ncbi:peptidoglycan-binding protein [Streptomyces sp. NPDC006632]|uniref:peptidoglycan-binding protein n=1 Tax=Streptomyces sp. NPDC006632 TaxID=3157182 RepID=UPI0033ACDD7D